MLCVSEVCAVVRCLSGWVAGYLSVAFVCSFETAKDTAIVAMECKKETVPKLSNDTILNNLD